MMPVFSSKDPSQKHLLEHVGILRQADEFYGKSIQVNAFARTMCNHVYASCVSRKRHHTSPRKQGTAFCSKKGFKINTEMGAPTVGAPVSVFILSLFYGLEIWVHQSREITPRKLHWVWGSILNVLMF